VQPELISSLSDAWCAVAACIMSVCRWFIACVLVGLYKVIGGAVGEQYTDLRHKGHVQRYAPETPTPPMYM
jgi:hypothetical protein